jgi:phosphatidylserine/phosphatidylglycerophosphate/cardiolipin synthase-like enzyme
MLRKSALLLALAMPLIGCRQIPYPELSRSTGTLEVHYSPVENLEALDSAMLRSAHSSIDLCAYSLTDHALTEAIASAASRGVRVRIYLDRVQTLGELAHSERTRATRETLDFSDLEAEPLTPADTDVLRQLAATPNVTIRVKHSRTLMHLKSYLIDNSILRSGSANFSPTGEKRQDNDLTFTHDRSSIENFAANFDRIWNRRDNEPLAKIRQ